MEVSIKRRLGRVEREYHQAVKIRLEREEEGEHKHTPPPHSRTCAKLCSPSTEILHTPFRRPGPGKQNVVPYKPVVTAAFFKIFTLSHMQKEREKVGIEPEYSSFLPQIILQVRSKCSTLPKKEKTEDIAKKDEFRLKEKQIRWGI